MPAVIYGFGSYLPTAVGVELDQLVLWAPDVFWLVGGILVAAALLIVVRIARAVRALHLASRLIVGSLYNATGSSVLIAGLFHAMHNAMVNPTGLGVAALDLPQAEVLVVLAGAIIAFATRRRLGLHTGLHSSAPSPTP